MAGSTEFRSGSGHGPAPDTIVAQATPPGVSAIAVVRLSGPESRAILARLAGGSELPPRCPRLLALRHPTSEEPLDRALVTAYSGPDSYTGEDLVELSCHGGWVTPVRVVEACVAAGAREAEPGEFTRRAVLNGKMDLIQAEAVLDLIEGRSRALRQVAVHQVEKGLSLRIASLRESLVQLEALLAHHIDFPEEDEAPVPLDRIFSEAEGVLAEMDRLLATAPEGELLREGALTVLAGKPNTGKSSLYNALIGRDRAIVTEIPGTTRDALEAVVSMGGFPFRLVDTAGIRESAEAVEQIGIEVSHRYLKHAEAVLYCCEAGTELDEDEVDFIRSLGGRRVTLVRTKADLAPDGQAGENRHTDDLGVRSMTVSTVSGDGLDELRSGLVKDVFGGLVRIDADAPVLTRERQTRAVRMARDGVAGFLKAVRGGVGAEMASTHLRPAETALEELLGVITTDDVLDLVFSQFCVGK